MSVNKGTSAVSKVGALIIGDGVSEGGKGTVTVSPAKNKGVYKLTATVNPGSSIAATAVYSTTLTTGAFANVAVGDEIKTIPPVGLEAGLTFSAFVTAAGTVTVNVINPTGSSINTASRTWTFIWTRWT